MERSEGYLSTEGDVANSKRGGLLRTQAVVSKYLFPLKGSPGLLREEADSRTGAGNIQDEPGTTCVPIK